MARGTLRIYLGAAPGVGKTFAMLDEGRRRGGARHRRRRRPRRDARSRADPGADRRPRGRPAPHHRLPRLVVRGDGRRRDPRARPEVALVDELAHTNVPGSRNEKRWQDVDELLDAGIDGHLDAEHPAPRVAQRRRRAASPGSPSARRSRTRSSRRADQIELVDMSPEALRRRMAHGNVYPGGADRRRARQLLPGREPRRPARAGAAVGRRPGRRGPRRVPATPRHRAAVGDARAGARGPHRSADGDRLVRRAARMAQRANGDLVAVHVRSQDGLTATATEALARQRTLVERLGGTYRDVVGDDVGKALVDTARRMNATQIVLGATRRSRLTELLRGSVIRRVIRESGEDVDVHVISHAAAAAGGQPIRRRLDHRFPAGASSPVRWPPRSSCRRSRSRSPSSATSSACRASSALSAAVIVVAASRRALARARRGRRRLPPRQLVLHTTALHVHDRRGREPAGARDLPHRRVDRQRLRVARGAARGRGPAGARRGRDAGAARRDVDRRRDPRVDPPDLRPRRRHGVAPARPRLGRRRGGRRPRGAHRDSTTRRRQPRAGPRRAAGARRRAPSPRRVRDRAGRVDSHRGARSRRLRGRRPRASERAADRDPLGGVPRPPHAARVVSRHR